MKILFIGDIVGKPARDYLKQRLPSIREELELDLIIANGENAAGGSSITLKTSKDIFDAGVDVVTTGDHAFRKKESRDVFLEKDAIRPLNYGEEADGQGYIIKNISGVKVVVVNLIGRVFMQPADCPFKTIRDVLDQLRKEAKIIIVDMHAEATSEKNALGYFLSGKVSAVVGTHTHIPTADEKIIDDFTAYITDVGMTGSSDSVLGREKDSIIKKFITNMPIRFDLAKNDVRMQCVCIEVDNKDGRALSIKRLEFREE